jgi:hypothetical protein
MVSVSVNCNLNQKLKKPNFQVQLGFFEFGFRFRFGYAQPDTAHPTSTQALRTEEVGQEKTALPFACNNRRRLDLVPHLSRRSNSPAASNPCNPMLPDRTQML